MLGPQIDNKGTAHIQHETSLPQLYIIHSWPRYVQHVISSSKGKHSEEKRNEVHHNKKLSLFHNNNNQILVPNLLGVNYGSLTN